tara:strand:- start:11601 stop:12272 length:672 start_codon:yes stop_codon:yes gene_type:complete
MNVKMATQKNEILIKNSSNLSEIFKDDINISILKRTLDNDISNAANFLLKENPHLEFSHVVNKNNSYQVLTKELGSNKNHSILLEDISNLVKMFCNQFGIDSVWLRIDSIDKPMCPRFHVDNVKCRLVTTYAGPGTQWLPNESVDRSKLGHGNQGLPDEKSGLILDKMDIEQLDVGHIALLKGEAWSNNDGFGLVHRSPHVEGNYKRLYVTIDFGELHTDIFG